MISCCCEVVEVQQNQILDPKTVRVQSNETCSPGAYVGFLASGLTSRSHSWLNMSSSVTADTINRFKCSLSKHASSQVRNHRLIRRLVTLDYCNSPETVKLQQLMRLSVAVWTVQREHPRPSSTSLPPLLRCSPPPSHHIVQTHHANSWEQRACTSVCVGPIYTSYICVCVWVCEVERQTARKKVEKSKKLRHRRRKGERQKRTQRQR